MCRRLGGIKGAQEELGIIIFSLEKEIKINWEEYFFVHHRTVSAVERIKFFSYRVSYMILRGRWCNIIVFNAEAPREEKSDDSKYSFYEELEQVFHHFPKYHMKILLRDFNAKVGREKIFKPTIGNESLHQDSNDNGVRILNFAT